MSALSRTKCQPQANDRMGKQRCDRMENNFKQIRNTFLDDKEENKFF